MSPTTSSASIRSSKRFALLASLALGSTLAIAGACTFDPPGSVLDNGGGGGGGGGAADGGGGGADGGDVTGESMTITFTSEPTGGLAQPAFAPSNLVATWIEDANGAFVQTINRQNSGYAQYLLGWAAMSGGVAADQDAVTGATRPNHATPISATWEIPAGLADGIYTIRIETTDGNAVSADQNTQGTFTFEKNGIASSQTPVGVGYTNVSIEYSGRE